MSATVSSWMRFGSDGRLEETPAPSGHTLR
jgi:hypothetical protein